MSERTNVDVATWVLDRDTPTKAPGPNWRRTAARTVLDAIDTRLADLTPEETTAILDWLTANAWITPLPAHISEVLSR